MKKAPLFPLGEIRITPGAEAILTPLHLAESLQRHQHGDYGEIGPEDEHQNRRDMPSAA